MGQTKIIMKRALRGLYAGRHIQFGNKISEDGGNKSRRSWKPNRQKRRLFSFGLDGYVRLDVTTHALRCMDRVGGLDEYLLKLPLREIHSEKILHMRNRIAQRYDKKTMLPKDLEKKVKAVLEWNCDQKTKKPEQDAEKGEAIGDQEQITAALAEPGKEDYLDRLFAKFSVKQELPQPSQKEEELSPLDFSFPVKGNTAGPKTKPSAEEFPESLFS